VLNFVELTKEFHHLLLYNSDKKKKDWWESYLRNAIPFLGVGIPEIRRLLKEWYKSNNLTELSTKDQLVLATEFIKGKYTEDKLTGILIIQLFLLKEPNHKIIITRLSDIFNDKLIFDWNTCDWLCVRILSPIIDNNDKECIEMITSWKDADYLWKARASAVAFAQVKDIIKYTDILNDINKLLINREERFAKTAVGWTLREISKNDKEFVVNFIKRNIQHFTKETINNSMKYFNKETRNTYLSKLK